MDIDLRTLERIQELTKRIDKIKVSAAKTTRTRPRKPKEDNEAAKPSSDSKRF